MSKFILLTFFLVGASLAVDSPQWTKLPGGKLKPKQISARGNEIWAVTEDRKVYRLENSQWQEVPVKTADGDTIDPNAVAASPDGWAWATSFGTLYRYNKDKKVWEDMGKDLHTSMFDCFNAASRDLAIAGWRDTEGHGEKMFKIAVYKNGKWEDTSRLPPLKTGNSQVAIGEDDDRWHVDESGGIYHWKPSSNPPQQGVWEEAPGQASSIDVHNSKRVLIQGRMFHQLYLLNDDGWKNVPSNPAVDVTITADAIYMLDEEGGVYTAKV